MKLETAQQGELGEVRLPQMVGRPLIHLIEPLNTHLSTVIAKSHLDDYQRYCRRFDGLRTWRLARRNCPVHFSGTIELISLSQWDRVWVLRVLEYLCNDLRLRYRVRLLFLDNWTMVDARNEVIISDSANPETSWDGDAWTMLNGGLARICLSPLIMFPFLWDNRRHFLSHLFREFTWFKTPVEMFLYLAAHRLRHLWQFEQPKKFRRVARLLQINSETDADIYALRVLSRYRHNPTEIIAANPVMQLQPIPLEKL